MSTAADSEAMMFCAFCGTAEAEDDDDVKLLKKCTACHLVKYCGVKCQRDHWPKHKRQCKKRAAELRDEILFKQPESNSWGDCPICCLPLPIEDKQCTLKTCCSKIICKGCTYANRKRETEARLEHKCPFCRKIAPDNYEEQVERLMKRIEANDPVAMCEMGTERRNKGDYNSAVKYYSNAAALGDVEAHYHLSVLYHTGRGVEKDEKKQLHHLTEAAIGGQPNARNNLGCIEWGNGRVDRAAKHWIIASKLGNGKSLERVKELYKAGCVSKNDFNAALRGYQAAIDATKSPQREEAAEYVE